MGRKKDKFRWNIAFITRLYQYLSLIYVSTVMVGECPFLDNA